MIAASITINFHILLTSQYLKNFNKKKEINGIQKHYLLKNPSLPEYGMDSSIYNLSGKY